MNGLADRIVELLLYTRKAADTKLGAFGLKEGLLFCLQRAPQPPRELMDVLGMAKSNLASLAEKCIHEGLIEKSRRSNDRRTLLYAITEKGTAYIHDISAEIEKKFATILTDEKEIDAARDNLDTVIELLSYL